MPKQDGILKKQIYEEVPLRVAYQLTTFGDSLLPVLEQMNTWGVPTKAQIREQL